MTGTPEPELPHARVAAHDRFFLDQEDPEWSMNVGACVLLDGVRPATLAGDVRSLLAARLHHVPRLRQRIAPVPVPGAPPVWVDDRGFDLDAHVAVLEPADPPALDRLLAVAGAGVAAPLDRSGALWDVAVVPRIADGGSALLVRWHHALADGMSGVELAKLLLSTRPDAEIGSPEDWRPRAEPSPEVLAAEELARRAAGQLEAAVDLALRQGDPDGQRAEARAFVEGLASFSRLGRPPPNPFPPSPAADRRYAAACVSAAELRAVGRRAALPADVVVLVVFAAAVCRLLEARGRPAAALRTLVPLTRPLAGRRAVLGNHATFVIVDLPVAPMPDGDRARAVAEAVRRAREGHQATAAAALIDSAERVPASVNRLTARWLRGEQLVHSIVSYMRGPRATLYLAGRRHVATVPILPRTAGIGLLAGVVNLGGVVGYGLVADPRGVPDLAFLARAIPPALHALAAAA